MATNVGAIEYDARINTSNFRSDASKVESQARDTGSRMAQAFNLSANDMSSAFSSAADTIGGILRKTLFLVTGSSIGLGLAIKQSFDQVRSVENARVTMLGFGASVEDVNKLFKETLSFVRGDLGVLFQREDIMATNTALFGMGIEMDKISKGSQTLAKATTAGNRSFDELTDIVRSVNAEGKLGVIRFRQLAAAGVFLDKSLIGTAMSGQQLLDAMEGVLPDSLIASRANTIDGQLIRLRSSFRDLGGAILGVDAETSQFVEGGLGQRLVGVFEDLRNVLRDPKFLESLRELGRNIATFAEKIIPALINAFKWVVNNFDTVIAAFGGLTAAFVAAKVAALIFSIIAMKLAIVPLLIAAAVTALVAAITFLEIRFGIISKTVNYASEVFSKFWEIIRPLRDFIGDMLVSAFNNLKESFDRVREALEPHKEQLLFVAKVLGGVVVLAIASFVANILIMITVTSIVIAVVAKLISWLTALHKRSFEVFKGFLQGVQSYFMFGVNIMRGVPGMIVSIFGGAGSWLVEAGKNIINGLVKGISDNFGNVKAKLGELTGKLTSWKGPLSLDKVILEKNGQAVIGGFINGLESQYGNVQKSLGAVTADMPNGVAGNYGSSSLPSFDGNTNDIGSGIENNIGTINIANEADGEKWLRKLTRNQEITSTGLTPAQGLM